MNVLDFSSLWLIEDSADSEGDDPAGLFSQYPSNIGHKEDDDAESCTCECDTDGIYSLLKEDDHQGCGEFCGDGDDGYGLNCSCSTMWNMSDAALEVVQCSSPNFLVDDDDDKVTRMVKVNVDDVDDKLFWEICMAVGYP